MPSFILPPVLRASRLALSLKLRAAAVYPCLCRACLDSPLASTLTSINEANLCPLRLVKAVLRQGVVAAEWHALPRYQAQEGVPFRQQTKPRKSWSPVPETCPLACISACIPLTL